MQFYLKFKSMYAKTCLAHLYATTKPKVYMTITDLNEVEYSYP